VPSLKVEISLKGTEKKEKENNLLNFEVLTLKKKNEIQNSNLKPVSDYSFLILLSQW
jgi:hypothetical protein